MTAHMWVLAIGAIGGVLAPTPDFCEPEMASPRGRSRTSAAVMPKPG
jgi:hypothetical protein